MRTMWTVFAYFIVIFHNVINVMWYINYHFTSKINYVFITFLLKYSFLDSFKYSLNGKIQIDMKS